MKIYFVTLCLFAVIVFSRGDGKSEDLKSYKECMAESGIKEDEVDKLLEKKDPRVQCILACVYEKEGLLSKGQIDPDAIKKSLTSDIKELDAKKISDVVDSCMSYVKKANEICEQAMIMEGCVDTELEKLIFKSRK